MQSCKHALYARFVELRMCHLSLGAGLNCSIHKMSSKVTTCSVVTAVAQAAVLLLS